MFVWSFYFDNSTFSPFVCLVILHKSSMYHPIPWSVPLHTFVHSFYSINTVVFLLSIFLHLVFLCLVFLHSGTVLIFVEHTYNVMLTLKVQLFLNIGYRMKVIHKVNNIYHWRYPSLRKSQHYLNVTIGNFTNIFILRSASRP